MNGKVTATLPSFRNVPLNLADARMRILVEATRVFVLTAYKNVPVDTGMARGTWRALGSFLNIEIPIEGAIPRGGKSIAAGEALSSFGFEVNLNTTTFNWSSDVVHYIINEQYPRIKKAPWHSLDKGAKAAISKIHEIGGLEMVNAIRLSLINRKRVY